MIPIVAAASLVISIVILVGCLAFRKRMAASQDGKSMLPIYLLYAVLYFALSAVGFCAIVFGRIDSVG